MGRPTGGEEPSSARKGGSGGTAGGGGSEPTPAPVKPTSAFLSHLRLSGPGSVVPSAAASAQAIMAEGAGVGGQEEEHPHPEELLMQAMVGECVRLAR